MSSLILNGDTSGAVTLAVPAVAGTNTVTIAAQTGTLNAAGPAFFVSRATTDQSISNATDTVVLFNNSVFDTASAYNSANGRFTPQVAGYYQINTNMALTGSAITLASSAIRKNGSVIAFVNTSAFTFTSTPYRFSGSTLIYCNGSTDYIDVTAYVAAASGQVVNIGSAFSGALVRGA